MNIFKLFILPLLLANSFSFANTDSEIEAPIVALDATELRIKYVKFIHDFVSIHLSMQPAGKRTDQIYEKCGFTAQTVPDEFSAMKNWGSTFLLPITYFNDTRAALNSIEKITKKIGVSEESDAQLVLELTQLKNDFSNLIAKKMIKCIEDDSKLLKYCMSTIGAAVSSIGGLLPCLKPKMGKLIPYTLIAGGAVIVAVTGLAPQMK